MSKIKTAVIGVGYLGTFHAQKHASLAECDLVGVVDYDFAKAQKIATDLKTVAYKSHLDIIDKVDAVCIASDTLSHYEIAKDCLNAGVHCFIEKPITSTVSQAEELEKISQAKKLVLQVGFLERFNSALVAIIDKLDQPVFIESHRLARFNPRGADVNVVLDLMIHDIDIILHIIKSKVKNISANGVAVLTPSFDIVNARIEFENNAVANITASRISAKDQRKMRFFQENRCLVVDFGEKQSVDYHKTDDNPPKIESDKKQHEANDAILIETQEFLSSIKNKTQPSITGKDGKNALKIATYITDIIQKNKK
jgi:predicted dehydrogenase